MMNDTVLVEPIVESGDTWRMTYDNGTEENVIASSFNLKVSVLMMVIYTTAYSAVFILGRFNALFCSCC